MNNDGPSRSLQVLFWESTLRCNAYCEFCGSSCGELSSDELLQSEVDAATICGCWNDIAETFDPATVMINVTGGEPLVRNDLFEIMSYAADLGFPWGMVTNGSLIDLETVENMKKSGMKTISISLDGCPNTHNSLRKIPNGFAKIKEAVRIINETAFLDDLQITTVVNHRNINELEFLFSELKTWGITSWRLATIDPIQIQHAKGEGLFYFRYGGKKKVIEWENEIKRIFEVDPVPDTPIESTATTLAGQFFNSVGEAFGGVLAGNKGKGADYSSQQREDSLKEKAKVKKPVEEQIRAKFCPNCGTKIIDGAKFCGGCGSPVYYSVNTQDDN